MLCDCQKLLHVDTEEKLESYYLGLLDYLNVDTSKFTTVDVRFIKAEKVNTFCNGAFMAIKEFQASQ